MAQAIIFFDISTFYGKNAEAFKLLGIAPEFIFLLYFKEERKHLALHEAISNKQLHQASFWEMTDEE